MHPLALWRVSGILVCVLLLASSEAGRAHAARHLHATGDTTGCPAGGSPARPSPGLPAPWVRLEGVLDYIVEEGSDTYLLVVQDPCPVTYLLGPTASVVSGQLAAVAAAPGHDVTLDCELRDTQGEGAEGANPAGQPSIRSCASVLNVVSNVQLSTSEVGLRGRTVAVAARLAFGCKDGASTDEREVSDDEFRERLRQYRLFFVQCSLGEYSVEWEDVLDESLGCVLSRCDSLTLSITADARLRANKAYAEAQARSVFLPQQETENRGCPWQGMARRNQQQAFYRLNMPPEWLVMHEMLHLFGVRHAGQGLPLVPGPDTDESDPTSCMGCSECVASGAALVCPNAPQLAYLGWRTAVPGGDLDGRTLLVGRPVEFQVPSQHGTRECFIRIQPTWLDDQYNQNLYISYRRSEGADQDLELVGTGAFADKVLLHQVSKAADARSKGPSGPGHASTQLLKDYVMPPTGGFIRVQPYRLVIRTAGFAAGDSQTVRVVVCRFTNAAEECPVYPPPPPSPAPPPPLPPSPLPPKPPTPPSPPPPPLQAKLTGQLAYMPGIFLPNNPALFQSVGAPDYFVLVLPWDTTALWPQGSTYAPTRYLRLDRRSFLSAANATTLDAALPLLQSTVALQCELDPASRTCVRVWDVQVLQPGPGRQALVGAQQVALYHVYGCGADAATIIADGRQYSQNWFAPIGSGPSASLSAALDACCTDSFSIARCDLQPITLPCDLPEAAEALRTCDAERVAELAEAVLRSLGGAPDKCGLRVFVLPDLPACAWAGRAYVGGPAVWLTAGAASAGSDRTAIKSLMLAWGMYPAWRGVRPGDDPTTPLGSAESRLTCPSAPEMSRLGWVPREEQLALDGGSLQPGRSRAVLLAPLPASPIDPGSVRLVRIDADWLASNTRVLYVSYRRETSPSAVADSVYNLTDYNGAIVVHAVRRAVDELGTASWADPQAVLTAQTLRWDGGARAVDIGSHNLVLHAAGLPSASGATLTICRYNPSANQPPERQCPAPASPPPPPSPHPSPPPPAPPLSPSPPSPPPEPPSPRPPAPSPPSPRPPSPSPLPPSPPPGSPLQPPPLAPDQPAPPSPPPPSPPRAFPALPSYAGSSPSFCDLAAGSVLQDDWHAVWAAAGGTWPVPRLAGLEAWLGDRGGARLLEALAVSYPSADVNHGMSPLDILRFSDVSLYLRDGISVRRVGVCCGTDPRDGQQAVAGLIFSVRDELGGVSDVASEGCSPDTVSGWAEVPVGAELVAVRSTSGNGVIHSLAFVWVGAPQPDSPPTAVPTPPKEPPAYPGAPSLGYPPKTPSYGPANTANPPQLPHYGGPPYGSHGSYPPSPPSPQPPTAPQPPSLEPPASPPQPPSPEPPSSPTPPDPPRAPPPPSPGPPSKPLGPSPPPSPSPSPPPSPPPSPSPSPPPSPPPSPSPSPPPSPPPSPLPPAARAPMPSARLPTPSARGPAPSGASCTGEITYIVLPGDTCSDIASWYGISVADLRAANPGLNCGALKLYQELCVPAAGPGAWPEPGLAPAAGPGAGPGAAPAPEAEACPVGSLFHLTLEGQTCNSIAASYGISLEALRDANPNVCGNLQIGTWLCIPPRAADTCTDLLGDEWCSGSVCCTLLARPPYDFCDSARATALGAEQQPGEFRSVTCPASCSTCSGCLPGVNVTGTTEATVTYAPSMKECRRRCSATPGCTFAVYNTNDGDCEQRSNPIKGKLGATRADPTLGAGGGTCFVRPTEGTEGRYTCVDGVDMSGDNLEALSVSSLGACRRECETRPRCAFFVYGNFSWGNCALRSNAARGRNGVIGLSAGVEKTCFKVVKG